MEQEASINLHGEKRGLLSVVVPAFNEAGICPASTNDYVLS
jgi:hypothetical protein